MWWWYFMWSQSVNPKQQKQTARKTVAGVCCRPRRHLRRGPPAIPGQATDLAAGEQEGYGSGATPMFSPRVQASRACGPPYLKMVKMKADSIFIRRWVSQNPKTGTSYCCCILDSHLRECLPAAEKSGPDGDLTVNPLPYQVSALLLP